MNIAILFAGGNGSRMNSRELPKQFLSIHGRPVIVRTAQLFQKHSEVDAIVIACTEDWIDYCKTIIDAAEIDKCRAIVPGGKTSQESINNALAAAQAIAGEAHSVVLIHDGVRPLIDQKTISDNIASVKEHGSAITCVEAKETLVATQDGEFISNVTARKTMRVARAPQSFWLDEILAAHEWAVEQGKSDYIDSATLMFEYGKELHIVMGPIDNIKLTTSGDFYSIQAILNAHENSQLYAESTRE